MKQKLHYIIRRLAWIVPLAGYFILTGMGHNPSDTNEPGTDNDKTAANTEKLIARWSFDAPNPGRNSVSDNFHARVGRKIRIVPGIAGKAAELSSGNAKDMSIEISPDILPAGLSELTFSAWIAPKTLDKQSTVICKEDVGVHGANRLMLAIRNSGQFLTLGINCGGNYAECNAPVSTQELCDGRWHLLAGTFDGRMMRVYLDGREIGSLERHAPLSTVHDFAPMKTWRDDIASSNYESLEGSTVRGVPMYIGSVNGKDSVFNGKIDDVRFYSRAIDGQTVAGLYSEGRQSPSAGLEKAQETAKALYSKGNSFIETLGATDKNLAQQPAPDKLVAVELQRLIRNDFPEETNAYIMKWQKSPLDNLLLSEKERRSMAEKLAPPAFEYLPLTDLQWSVLPKSDRSKWDRVKWIRSQFDLKDDTLWIARIDKTQLGTTLYEMENLVEERPRIHERVARYVEPYTPATVDRTADEALEVIRTEWLFQCDGKPTVQRTLDEIKWARKLASRLNLDKNIIGGFNTKFEELEAKAKAKSPESEDKDLYFAVRTLKRELMFKNPVIDFESILYIDNPNPSGGEWQHETRHRLGYQAVPGGRLIVQKGLSPGGKMTKLMPQEPLHGTFWRPDLSYDGKQILFSYKPHNEKTFHIYEIGVDGTNLRQLTGGIFDDFDPIYMPDGKNIMFLTTRGHIYVRCMPPTNAFVMARMPLDTKPGDKSLYIISRSGEPEYTPSILNDGRVIYTRWEYTDKPLWRAQSLWTMRQNG
ncbi:MAG: hypothetical protein LBK07_00285, partial [Tannerella sp.]|nr:hypothetical protein [Tannerella sp.]